jgi:hypothetical protein
LAGDLLKPKHLIERLFIGDQTGLDQIPTGFMKFVFRKMKTLTDGLVAIITQPFGVAYSDQKKIKGGRFMAQVVDVTVPDQALIHKTKLFGDLSELVSD